MFLRSVPRTERRSLQTNINNTNLRADRLSQVVTVRAVKFALDWGLSWYDQIERYAFRREPGKIASVPDQSPDRRRRSASEVSGSLREQDHRGGGPEFRAMNKNDAQTGRKLTMSRKL